MVTEELSIIRKVKLVDHSDQVCLSTIDTENYGDFQVDRSEITEFYSVEKILSD